MRDPLAASCGMTLVLCIGLAAPALAGPRPAASAEAASRSSDVAIDFGSQESSGADRLAIEALLADYTSAVTAGDEAKFRGLLVNDQIPFSGVGRKITTQPQRPFDERDFKSFQNGIFRSGKRYTQTFHDVHILQDGALAQVSLDFVTRDAQTGTGGWGWKVLQLLKLDGRWKIASEFYTGHPLPSVAASGAVGRPR